MFNHANPTPAHHNPGRALVVLFAFLSQPSQPNLTEDEPGQGSTKTL
jgi:hypothetical protein